MDNEYILKTFESIGIPKMQTLVYLDLLKHRESSATDVSKRTKMHRANVYDTLTKLKERNLVFLSTKEGRQVFAALPSELIVSEEKDRLENLKLAMDYIKTIYLPGEIPKIYTVEGTSAVKSLLFGILEKKSNLVWIYGLAKLVHAKAKVSPIITIVGVIGGASMFGIIGIFIGPILLPLILIYFETFKERFD